VKAVLFDLGNTLVKDTAKGEVVKEIMLKGLWEELSREGINVTLGGLREALNESFREQSRAKGYLEELKVEEVFIKCFNKLGIPCSCHLSKCINAYFGARVNTVTLYDDVIPTLEKLKSLKLKLGLISNALPDGKIVYEALGLNKYFDIAIFSFEKGVKKPHPQLFEEALDSLGIGAEETIMVGDSLEADVLGARLTGIRAILIIRKWLRVSYSIIPDYIITDLRQLLELLS